MELFDILNGKLLYSIVMVGLATIFAICLFFFLRSRKRALELGVSKEVFNSSMKSSAIFSVIPSISVIIGLISLSPLLGIPWPWFRLSVVGSLGYELMSGDMAATGAGYESLADFSRMGSIDSLGTIMFVMSVAIISGMVFNLFFLKSIHTRIADVGGKQDKFVALALSSLTIAMMSVFVPMQFITSKIHAITLISSVIITYGLNKISVKATWLRDYIMSIALIGGMAVAVITTNIIG